MAGDTKIQWSDKSWNPTRGCSRVSPGCQNCYAEKVAHRFSGPGAPYEGLIHMVGDNPQWNGEMKLIEKDLEAPLHWRKPCRIFVNSMSDLFHDGVPDYYIARVFAVMESCPHHTFQILTKRPERMRAILSHNDWPMYVRKQGYDWLGPKKYVEMGPHWRNNVWLGVSVEDQKRADERIPILMETPAAVRFISAEPLLDVVDVSPWVRHRIDRKARPDIDRDVTGGLDWAIIGGESGPGARPMDLAWVRKIVSQCAGSGTAVFVKQLGAKPIINRNTEPDSSRKWPVNTEAERALAAEALRRYFDKIHPYPLVDKKGGEPHEWPPDLRIREFPVGA